MSVKTLTKKPVAYKAVQFTGEDSLDEIREFVESRGGEVTHYPVVPADETKGTVASEEHIYVSPTPNGASAAFLSDWVIDYEDGPDNTRLDTRRDRDVQGPTGSYDVSDA